MNLLEIRGLTFDAGGRKILDSLDLDIASGEVHALLGTNGTGKSTLAYLIMGCDGYRPSGGDILFDGKSITGLMMHERSALGITMAWQEPVRFEGISVSDYIRIKNKDADAEACLTMAGLHPEMYVRRMVDKCLSGGERKRIELASILALNPRLAVLDEPDSGIDMLSMQDIINVISAFKRNGAAVLLITHRHEVAIIADTASQLCFGRITCTGSPRNVAEYFISRRCYACENRECIYV